MKIAPKYVVSPRRSFVKWLPLIIAIAFLTTAGCSSRNHYLQSESETLHRSIGGEPSTLDPGQATDTFSFAVLRDVYEGLTTDSPTGGIVPGVAESWTVNSTGTEYKFDLRPNARWSNGVRVKPQDFVRAWRRVVDPKAGSPVADNLRPIVGAPEIIAGKLPLSALGVRVVGKYSLVVKLSKPTPYFLQLLTHTALFPVYSEAAAETHSPRNWVSNGPYKLSKWIPGEKIIIAKNGNYWDSHNVKIATVVYLFTPDENAELREYLAGEIDVTDSVPATALPWIKKHIPRELHVWPFLGTAYYAINMDNPRFRNNVALRKSLAMAIDRRLLVSDVLDFGQRPAYGFVPIGTWNYSPQFWEWRKLNDVQRIAEARRLYKQAGYSRRKPLQIRLLINADSTIRDTALATAAMWKRTLGVQTQIIEQEYRVFLQTRRDASQWDVARLGWTADYDDASDFLDIFRARSPNNDARYADPNFDFLMNEAAETGNPTQRRRILESAEALMLSDYPVIPIYFYVSKCLVKPYVGGVHSTIMNRLYSKYLYIKPH